jgi:hypothetical protein
MFLNVPLAFFSTLLAIAAVAIAFEKADNLEGRWVFWLGVPFIAFGIYFLLFFLWAFFFGIPAALSRPGMP